MATLLRGEVRTATISPSVGVPGASGFCHVLILSSDNFNFRTDTAIVLPVDYSQDNFDLFDSMQIHTVQGMRSPAWVLLGQIRALTADRINELIGTMDPDEVLKVQKALWKLLHQ